MNKAILFVQRFCPHCIDAMKVNVLLGGPFKVRMISNGPYVDTYSLSGELVKISPVRLPLVIRKLNGTVIGYSIPWEKDMMIGYMEEMQRLLSEDYIRNTVSSENKSGWVA